MTKENIYKVLEILSNVYSDAKCALNFKTPYQLLVATILSAQCTDVRVNKVTSELFKENGTPDEMIKLTQDELGEKIKSCGLYKNKSKNILNATKDILTKFNGEVPKTMEELTTLSGVGRKTANVVLSNAFKIPAIAVDTHVFRVSNRIGIGKGKNVLQVENELRKNVPKDMWSDTHHYLIWHGRNLCKARNPKCEECPLDLYCEYYLNQKNK